MDFSNYTDRVIIRRATLQSNPSLSKQFKIDSNQLPVVYLITKDNANIKYDLFDNIFISRYKAENNIKDISNSDSSHYDIRQKIAEMILTFLNLQTKLVNLGNSSEPNNNTSLYTPKYLNSFVFCKLK